ncbi:MAG: cutinase family protein [Mycobacterium sp.]
MFVKRLLLIAVLATAAINSPATPAAAAEPCPDVEVIFARGTGGAGLGDVGQAFVDAVRSKAAGRSVDVYSVNYPASFDFSSSVPVGAADAAARVQWMTDNCPTTKLVLSGISQGAGVIDLITMDQRPLGDWTPTPMAPQLANHVAAVAVFGNPAGTIPGGGSLTAMSSLYGGKTIDLCAPDDMYCAPGGNSFLAHLAYVQNGMVEQAADFVASRLT